MPISLHDVKYQFQDYSMFMNGLFLLTDQMIMITQLLFCLPPVNSNSEQLRLYFAILVSSVHTFTVNTYKGLGHTRINKSAVIWSQVLIGCLKKILEKNNMAKSNPRDIFRKNFPPNFLTLLTREAILHTPEFNITNLLILLTMTDS
jgi:hypothetical protein